MKYKFLLFDADNTILDFDDAEENALKRALTEHDYPFDNHVLEVYKRNNIFMWEQLEKGLADKDTVREKRFALTFDELGWKIEKIELYKITLQYEKYLEDGFATIPHAEEVLQKLQDEGHRLILVSNGFLSVQNARMRGSGLCRFFPTRYISEQVGYSKPQKEFFEFIFARITDFDVNSTLIIGDSLTSDIKGGINAGIPTCWFNPNHKPLRDGIVPTYEIDDLRKIFEIVG